MAQENKPAEAAPEIMPWQEKWDLKPSQASPETSGGGGIVSTVINAVKGLKMPWEMDWKEKPRSNPTAQGKVVTPTTVADSFMTKLEGVESGYNPEAKNPNSTATGLHQFTASTWREAVNQMGKNYSLADRKDVEKSREVFKFLTKGNEAKAKADLGRSPTETELYLYHFLGKNAAGDFIKAPGNAKAIDHVSDAAARSNRSVFYNKGVARTVDEVKQRFASKF